jgi:cardiolipin synthase
VVDERLFLWRILTCLDDFHDPNHGELQAPIFDFAVILTWPLMAEDRCHGLLYGGVQAGYSARQRHLNEAWEKFKVGGGRQMQALGASWNLRFPTWVGSSRPKAALVLRDNSRNRHSIEMAYRKSTQSGNHHSQCLFLPGGKLRWR